MIRKVRNKLITNILSKVIALKWLVFTIGLSKTIHIFIDLLRHKSDEYRIEFPFLEKNVVLDIVSSRTDLAMLTEVFCFQSYEIREQIDPRFIIDAGANKGLTTIYFSIKYPKAEIHCYEPNIELIPVLEKHIRINNVKATVFNAAISDTTGLKSFEKSKNHQYSKLVENDTAIKINTISLNDRYMGRKIDILKMDIEGEEEKVICYLNFSVIDVRVIIQEIHYDRVNHNRIFSKLKENGYRFSGIYPQYYYLNPEVERPILLAIKD
jgi:FkbM family methyltransferase